LIRGALLPVSRQQLIIGILQHTIGKEEGRWGLPLLHPRSLQTAFDLQSEETEDDVLIRFAILVLLAFTLSVPSASAQKMNYLSGIIDLTELIPPPPPTGSEAFKVDLADVIEMQEKRTDAQVRRAISDNILSIYRFEDVLGPKFKRENLPVLDAFLARAQADARAILIATKNAIQRPRPALASKDVAALGGTPRLPTAYPSGGVVFTTLTSIVLAKMVPEKHFELAERNREYALNRVVLGQHFPRDVRAGEISGTVIAYGLMNVPAFMRDLEAARTELRQVLGYPAQPSVGSPAKQK
jgi:acid phosphatase (class A)